MTVTVEHRVDLKSNGMDTPGWKALAGMGANGDVLPGIVPDGEPTPGA